MRMSFSIPCGVLWAALAAAQPIDNKAEADRLFGEGIALLNKNDLAGAREKFALAYAKFPSPNALINLARMEHLTGRCVDAVPHYAAYRALPDNPRITPADREEARKYEGECIAKIGRISIDAPSSATIVLDDRITPWRLGEPIYVQPGAHVVEIRTPGKSVVRDITCAPGEIAQAHYEDRPITTPAATPPPAEPPKPSTTRWILGGGLVGVGVTAMVFGIGFLTDSASAISEADSLRSQLGAGTCPSVDPPSCMKLQSLRSRRDTDMTAGGVFLGIGGAVLLGGVATMLLWPSPKTRARIVPMTGPSLAGASCSMVF